MVDAIRQDALDNTNDRPFDIDDGADELLRRWNVPEDAEEPSKDDDESGQDEETSTSEDKEDDSETDDEQEDNDSDESDEDDKEDDSDEDEDEKSKKRKVVDDDDSVVKVKVDGKEHEVPVKDLKRLWGQEQALNRKSEETAAVRKQAEESGAKYVAGVAKMLELAQARYEPFSKIDFLVAAKELDAEELTTLRTEAQRAWDELKFFEQELDTVVKEVETHKHQERLKEAREAQRILSDPKDGIPGWSEKLYDDIRAFAILQGIPEVEVNQLTNPVAFKIMHKAMLYDKGQKALDTKTKKIDKTPKKVIKTSANAESTRKLLKPNNKAMEKLRSSGDIDDAADAFLSKWSQ